MAPRRSARSKAVAPAPAPAPAVSFPESAMDIDETHEEQSPEQSPAQFPAAAPAAAGGKLPRNKRYSKVSVSGNLDSLYQEKTKNKPQEEAYSYICLCSPPFPDREPYDPSKHKPIIWRGNETPPPEAFLSDSEEEDEETCDGGETCICTLPATSYPGHKWTLTAAARWKFFYTRINCDVRNPDLFEIYTFNDHSGINDSYKLTSLCLLFGRLFLHTLSHLERLSLLSPTSEIHNLGTIMGLWISIAEMFRTACYDLLGCEEEQLGLKKDKKTFAPPLFDDNIIAYAEKYGIQLKGPKTLDMLLEEYYEEEDHLPSEASNKTIKSDPWKFFKGV
ncbi:hypothetical protein AA313_de0201354 [Arthrobotrys entomopaga]|nr:hypothetical protein AA313_de0201354 [Arthrobotrys entomopaga]